MTETSYYPPTASRPRPGGAGTRGPILVAVAGSAAQSRATVAFRIILAIPHFLVLYFLGIAASVVAVIGWLGALVTGRLPRFAATYLSGYLGWYCRVGAYLLLLTDEYPPFLFEDAAYPVRVAVSPGRLNRLTVLFRIILAIPAAIVSLILAYGVTTIVIFIAWLTALVAGKLPGSLHQAFAAVLRYSTRYYGYLYLLTDVYPAGLFGDKPGIQTRAETPPGGPGYGATAPGHATPDPGYGAPATGYATPGYGTPGYGTPDTGYGTPGYGTPVPGYGAPAVDYGAPDYGPTGYGAPAVGYGAPDYGPAGYATPAARYEPPGYGTPRVPAHRRPAAGASGPPASWELVLPAGAKRLVGLILVLGLLTVAATGVSAGAAINSVRQRDNEINQLNAAVAQHNNAVAQEQKAADQVSNAVTQVTAAHVKLDSELNASVSKSGACSTVSCFDAAAVIAAGGNAAFGRRLRATPIPAGAAAVADRLVTDATLNEQGWMNMAHAVSFTDYANRATQAEKVGTRFDHDYSALIKALNREAAALNREAAALNQGAAALSRRGAALNVPVGVRTSPGPSPAAAT